MRNSSAIVFIAGVVFIIFVNEASLEIKSVAHICGREFYDVLPRGDIVMINVDIKKMHQKIKEGRQTSRKKKQFSDPDFQHKNIIFVARIDNKIARR